MKLLNHKINPLALFFIILFIIICCSVTAFYIANEAKQSMGTTLSHFVIKDIFQNEPWTFEVDNYKISLPRNSYMGPVYLEDQIIGMVVLSEGSNLENTATRKRYTPDNFFLTLSSETYTQIKGDTLFLPLDSPVLQRRITAAAQPLIRLPEVQGIAYTRTFLPPPEITCIYLEGGETIPATSCSVAANTRPLLLFFGLVVLVVLLTIYLLTMDLVTDRTLKRLYAVKPVLWERLTAFILLLVLLVAGTQGRLLNYHTFPVHIDTIIFYYGIIFLLLILCKKQFISAQGFGLTSGLQSYSRGFVVVPVILTMITLFSTLKFPHSFDILASPPQQMVLQFLLFFSYAFALEFFWRGFLQTFLVRLWGKTAGLIFVTVLITLPLFLAAYQATGLPLPVAKGLEVYFFFPLTALLIGYLYQRTHNLPGVALLHALLLFLPNILTF